MEHKEEKKEPLPAEKKPAVTPPAGPAPASSSPASPAPAATPPPVAPATAATPPPVAPTPAAPASDPRLTMGKGKTVLIVDDDPGSIELLKGILEKVGFQVAGAKDGQEAMTKLAVTKPNLMIVDVLMPQMDGFTFFKELKKNKETENIPVVILTIRKNMEDSFMAMGVNGFLAKPVDTEALLNTIANLRPTPPPAAPSKEAPQKPEEKK